MTLRKAFKNLSIYLCRLSLQSFVKMDSTVCLPHLTDFGLFFFTCSNCISSLVDGHLSCHMHKDLGLWTGLDMCCRNHCCGYCAGVHCHTIPLEFLGCSTSSGRADHSHHSSCLASSRHGNFCLWCTCHRPAKI